jgi:hypothetical protein
MLPRVLARRAIATAHMAALRTTPQVQPPAAGRKALDASSATRWYRGVDSLPSRFHAHLQTDFQSHNPEILERSSRFIIDRNQRLRKQGTGSDILTSRCLSQHSRICCRRALRRR